MRLFVAVDLSRAARAAIAGFLEDARHRPGLMAAPLRWVAPAVMHVTLEFIGEVEEGQANALATVLARPYGAPAFEVRLGGVGTFPARGPVRIVWLGVTQGASALAGLHDEVVRRLASAGHAPAVRPFMPHVTIARARGVVKGAIRSRLRALPAADLAGCPVERVTLYESRLGPSGPEHSAMTSGECGG